MLTLSLPTWRPFPDTVQTLHSLQTRYRLAVISNIDDDLLAASLSQLTVPFEQVVTSGQTACYKPRLPIFEEALRRLQAGPGTVAHIAEGADEVVPARRLGCATVWVRRNGRSARFLQEPPDLEVPDLRSLLVALNTTGQSWFRSGSSAGAGQPSIRVGSSRLTVQCRTQRP